MNLKTIWPFSIYYRLEADLDYYKKRHSDLVLVLNERNNEISKNRDEMRRMWNEKIALVEYLTSVEGKMRMLSEENKSMAELISKQEPQKETMADRYMNNIPISGKVTRKRKIGKMAKQFYPPQEGHGIIIEEKK